MSKSAMSLSKKVLYSGITILLLLVIAELLSRAYYYRQLHRHPFAVVQVAKDVRDLFRKRLIPDTTLRRVQRDHYLVRPGFTKAENDELVRDVMEANIAVYEPWVEFAFRDIQSRYVNVSGHVRRSVPDRSDSLAKAPFRIFFLGGSTTYGFNVADEETIPSCFVRAYRQKYPGGRPIQVINLAMPSYFSYQELIVLADKLFHDEKPDMVIMLDGMNDCFQAAASINRQPLYTPGMEGQTRPGENLRQLSLLNVPSGIGEDSACKMIYQHYIDNIRHVRELTTAYSIRLYCFWQPVPFYNYPDRRNDPVCSRDTIERFGKIYPLVKKASGEIPYLFFLGDMLQDEKGLPFIDKIHYSPHFSQVIAEKMLNGIVFNDNK